MIHKNSLHIFLIILIVAIAFVAPPAQAWGPGARQAITMSALQMIRFYYDKTFTAEESNYEADLLRGAQAGIAALGVTVPLNTHEQTVAAVGHEIRLLRAAIKEGTGSFFAYRMGVLSALVSEVVLPFGFTFDEEDLQIKEQVDADIDKYIGTYTFVPERGDFTMLRDPDEYFRAKRIFYDDDLKLIGDDYRQNRGYRGFLAEAGETYFGRAVEAVTDAWFTVITSHALPNDDDLSPRIMTWYLVDKVKYLISEKRNLVHADIAYKVFEEVNPNIMETYDAIGDAYYSHGTKKAKERGVREWKIAQRQPGPQRKRVSKKLATHYIEQGRALFQKSSGPDSEDKDLDEALRSFKNALEFERGNDIAARHITETTVAISSRRERLEAQQSLIDKALEVIQQAEVAHMGGSFEAAITTYNQSLMLLGAVDTEFRALAEKARREMTSARQSIREVINDVIDQAYDLIEEGDDLVDRNQFDQGINAYNQIEGLVSVIPEDAPGDFLERRDEVIEEANSKIAGANQKKARFQQDQSQANPGSSGND